MNESSTLQSETTYSLQKDIYRLLCSIIITLNGLSYSRKILFHFIGIQYQASLKKNPKDEIIVTGQLSNLPPEGTEKSFTCWKNSSNFKKWNQWSYHI